MSAAALYCAGLAAGLAQRGHAVRLDAEAARPLAAICAGFLTLGAGFLLVGKAA